MDSKINYILEDINNNLVYDYDKDIAYLESQIEKYNGHIYEKEIINKINEIIVQFKFQNDHKDLEKVSRKEEKKYNAIYEKALELIEEGKKKEAKKVLEKFIFEVKKIYASDEKVYVSLNGMIEYNLLERFFKTYKVVFNINIKAVEMYQMYANLLIEENELDKAAHHLLTAININPVSTKIYYTLAEVYRRQNKLKDFKEAVDIAYRYTYKIEDLAKYYVYRTYLCVVAKKIEYASALYTLAIHYKANKQDIEMLNNFCKSVNQSLKKVTLKESVNLISQTKIPIGASKYVYEILVKIYTHSKDLNVKEMYRRILYGYTKSGAYKDRIKLAKSKDNIKDISKIVETMYKCKSISTIKKDETKIAFFDFCTYFPNVIENMLKFEYGIDKHSAQVTCDYDILKVSCDDCKFKNCPIYTYYKKEEELKNADNKYLNILDFVHKEQVRGNKEEDIEKTIKEINKIFKDIVSIKAAKTITNANFIRDVKEENNKLEYVELNFENTTKENKIIETMQSFYKKEIGDIKEVDLNDIKHIIKEGTSYIFKESPYFIAAYVINLCKKNDVDEEIVYNKIINSYEGNLSIRDLIYTRYILQKLHNIKVGKELESKLNEMIVYIAAYKKSDGKLPYISFNIALNKAEESVALSVKNIILDVIKYFKYNKELEIKVIKKDETITKAKWYSIKDEIKKSKENILVIMYGESVINDKMFNITATVKEYSKKEIANQIMNKLENTYPCVDDLEKYILNYVNEHYKESELRNMDYVNYMYKKIIYNATKIEDAKKLITESEIY